MEETYQHLLSVDFKHNYFKEGKFKSLRVTFDQETAILLRQLGLILKSFPGGAHFFMSDPELLKDENHNAPIRLFLDCSDPYFINYTELPSYGPSDTVLYFNNIYAIPDSEGTGFQLPSEAYVGQSEVVPLSSGRLSITDFDPDSDYRFEDVLGNDLSDHFRLAPDGSNEFLTKDLPQGIVNIVVDMNRAARVYYHPSTVWKKPLGILEIDTVTLLEQFNTNGKQDYGINFDTRLTVWKYFLVDPVYRKFEDLSIIDQNKEVVFHPPKKQLLQETEALVFESKYKMALSEFSEDHFQLVDQFDTGLGSGKVVLSTLPLASPEQLYREESSSTGSLYSHIYI